VTELLPGAAVAEVGPHFQLYRASADGPVRWRLLGGNNRPLGRSSLDFPDIPACLQELTVLVGVLTDLAGRVDRYPPNLWIWRLALQGMDVVVSAHPYDRQIRARHGMRQFIDRAAVARVDAAVMVTTNRRGRPLTTLLGSRRTETLRR